MNLKIKLYCSFIPNTNPDEWPETAYGGYEPFDEPFEEYFKIPSVMVPNTVILNHRKIRLSECNSDGEFPIYAIVWLLDDHLLAVQTYDRPITVRKGVAPTLEVATCVISLNSMVQQYINERKQS